MAVFSSLLTCLIIVTILSIIAYLLSYRRKVNNLNPSAQKCYHINACPSLTSLLPKLILFSIIKSQGTPLKYCQLISPHKPKPKDTKSKDQKSPKKRRIQTINVLNPQSTDNNDVDEKETFEYFSQIEVMIESIAIDPLHLVSYNKLFKSDNYEQIPICYLEAMRFTLTPYIISKDQFPLSPLGLIHIGTEISMYQRLKLTDKYEITTSMNQLRQTKKGIEIDIATSVYLLNEGSSESRMVYQSIETLLSRNKSKMREYKRERNANIKCVRQRQNEWRDEFDVSNARNKGNEIVKKEINIGSDIGLRYAKVSNDYNPHHLSKWSAMFVGYNKGAIVHGMWSLQTCLSEIKRIFEQKSEEMFIYKYPIKVVSTFKLPIYTGAKVKLICNYYSKSKDYLTFALVSKEEKVPHVLGSVIVDT